MRHILIALTVAFFLASCSHAPVPVHVDVETDSQKMVLVKGDCFQMGDTIGVGMKDELPVHEVCLDDYYIAEHEVTQKDWADVMGYNPSYFRECGNDCPVENVTWNEVQSFIDRLNRNTGKTYRLPTEAEWEFAARARGGDIRWAGTNNFKELMEYCWFEYNSFRTTHPVKNKKPNGIGLYDMSGNVREWVFDGYSPTYYLSSPKDNPKGAGGDTKVLRGGSYYHYPRDQRCAKRIAANADRRFANLGFRLAADGGLSP